MKYHKWHEDWIMEHFNNYKTIKELHEAYCEKFDVNSSLKAMMSWCKRRGLKSNRYEVWSNEEIEWLRENYHSYSVDEASKLLHSLFGIVRTRNSIKSEANKIGVKQDMEVRAKTLSKINSAEIGKLYENPNGYTYIRLESGWYPYHKYILEKAVGKIPTKYSVIFKDGDSHNLELDNLIAIPNKWQGVINHNNWNDELLETGLTWCELRAVINGDGSRLIATRNEVE